MKLYDFKIAPSPRRVRIFLSEKKIEIEKIQVNLMKNEHKSDEFKKKNISLTVPILEIEDGTYISEINACCRYIDEKYPENNLMGSSPKEKALIDMWNLRIEFNGFLAATDLFRNSTKGYENSAKTGPNSYKQIPELVNRSKEQLKHLYALLNEHLKDNLYIARETLSIADITAFVTIDFAKWKKIEIPADFKYLSSWYEKINKRPSSKA